MKPTNREELVYRAVVAGWFEIRSDGSIWRIAQRHKSHWKAIVTIKAVTPHRIDAAVGVGYRVVKVMVDRKQTTALAHRLVWRHFHGSIPQGLTINHKNGVKSDNRPINLELATYSEQVRHTIDVLGTARVLRQKGESNAMRKLTESQVREIRRRRSLMEPLASIAAGFGISMQNVSKIARGDRWGSIL